VSAAIGAGHTLVAAGAIGAGVTLAALFLPGMRAVEEQQEAGPERAPEAVSAHAPTPAGDAPDIVVELIVLGAERALRDVCEPRLAARLESIGLHALADLRGRRPKELVAAIDAAAERLVRWTPAHLDALAALVAAAAGDGTPVLAPA